MSTTRRRKLIILAATLLLTVILLRVSLGVLFYWQESAILQAARRVSSPADVQTFVAKYNVVYHPPNDLRINNPECNYYSRPAPFYVHQHYFSWHFNQAGRRVGYFRSTYREIFGMEFSESEADPSS
jgi:hypothetical protein